MLHCVLHFALQCGLQGVLKRVLQGVLQCVLTCVLRCVLQCVCHCVIAVSEAGRVAGWCLVVPCVAVERGRDHHHDDLTLQQRA